MDLITQRKGKWPQFVNPDGNVIGYENSELFFRLINHERKIVILAAKARKNMDKQYYYISFTLKFDLLPGTWKFEL